MSLVQYGLNEHGVNRALVVDLDVHQGDGTQRYSEVIHEWYV